MAHRLAGALARALADELHYEQRAGASPGEYPYEFASLLMAGFECSSHRRGDEVRLHSNRATADEKHALGDDRSCAALGLRTIRDGSALAPD